jgi:3-methylcrotonyl-CoA carboxylase alpha subunit
MIKKLLIANRGEIACRIIKTARKMGIRTVAIYSDADENALHVKLADESYRIGAAAVNASYLRAGRILTVAKENGVDAIHPGYGFLSENAEFAELCAAAGIKFVGPPADAIRAMGLKDKAKSLMQSANVPVVAGFHGDNQQPEFLKRKAYEIGYPIMLKAVAGGGGKGMRIVEKAIGFDEALDSAKREAMNAFGNDRMLIEKFVSKPRHIEMQIFADNQGNVIHLGERDCSLQRRHQKVIEEAPAPGMTPAIRATMGRAACDAAKAVGYEGAGTVEFIVDGEGGLKLDGFYFMEMNTRLQVEHPITEMITGQDLVEWQLRIASGEALPLTQDDVELSGHAFEARIYAEDPDNGFLPSTGELIALDLPKEHVRIDSGVVEGDHISPHYDPMIAKLIVHGSNRETALAKLHQALENSVIAGLRSNIGFLARLANNEDFKNEQFDTGLIDRQIEDLILPQEIEEPVIALGIKTLIANEQSANKSQTQTNDPWDNFDAYSGILEREQDYIFTIDGEVITRRIRFNGVQIDVLDSDNTIVNPSQSAAIVNKGKQCFILQHGRQYGFAPHNWQLGSNSSDGDDGVVRVPMHGKIIHINVTQGDEVKMGDTLFVIESMKMEHQVPAPIDGIVEEIAIKAGEQFDVGMPAIALVPTTTQS